MSFSQSRGIIFFSKGSLYLSSDNAFVAELSKVINWNMLNIFVSKKKLIALSGFQIKYVWKNMHNITRGN